MIIEMPGAMQRPAFFTLKKCGLSVGNSLFFRVTDQQSIIFAIFAKTKMQYISLWQKGL